MPTCVSPVYAVLLENVRQVRARELARVQNLQQRNIALRAEVQAMRNIVREQEARRTRRDRRRFGIRGGVFRVWIEEDDES